MPEDVKRATDSAGVLQLTRSELEGRVQDIKKFVDTIQQNMTTLSGVFDTKLTDDVAFGVIAKALKEESNAIKTVMEKYNQAITQISNKLTSLAGSVQERDASLSQTFAKDTAR